MADAQPVGSWKYRRRYLVAVSLFAMAVIAFVLFKGADTELAQTALTMSYLTLSGNVGSYVFGASWDDANARKYAPKG
jgi:hypothetical protein